MHHHLPVGRIAAIVLLSAALASCSRNDRQPEAPLEVAPSLVLRGLDSPLTVGVTRRVDAGWVPSVGDRPLRLAWRSQDTTRLMIDSVSTDTRTGYLRARVHGRVVLEVTDPDANRAIAVGLEVP
jgi:hypothetical protein